MQTTFRTNAVHPLLAKPEMPHHRGVIATLGPQTGAAVWNAALDLEKDKGIPAAVTLTNCMNAHAAEQGRRKNEALQGELEFERLKNLNLESVADTDDLTGLPTMRPFRRVLESALAELERHPDRTITLVGADLEGLHATNKLDRKRGDGLLQYVARAVKGSQRAVDSCARAGKAADEYLMMFREADPNSIESVIFPRIRANAPKADITLAAIQVKQGQTVDEALAELHAAIETAKAARTHDRENYVPRFTLEDLSTPTDYRPAVDDCAFQA